MHACVSWQTYAMGQFIPDARTASTASGPLRTSVRGGVLRTLVIDFVFGVSSFSGLVQTSTSMRKQRYCNTTLLTVFVAETNLRRNASC